MNLNVRQMWVDALRSGKYTQSIHRLKVPTKDDAGNLTGTYCHCALGVLVEVYQEHSGTPMNERVDPNGSCILFEPANVVDPASATLNRTVTDWAGLVHSEVRLVWEEHMYPIQILNDSFGVSFEELADLIDEQL